MCKQCASAAPGSFQMLEQGRARTFCQRNSPDVISAVASCPVDCMHYVSFDELKELETARDVGVADDHRHFGHSSTRGYIAPTPLHVSRSDSDANHKSSFYQYVAKYVVNLLQLHLYIILISNIQISFFVLF
jgi:ferredoxin